MPAAFSASKPARKAWIVPLSSPAGAREDAPVGIERAGRVLPVDEPGFGQRRAHRRLEGIGDPALLAHGLAVIMRIEENGAHGAGNFHFRKDGRRRVGRGCEDLRCEAAGLQQALDIGRVLLDIGDVGRDIGQREQIHEIEDDLFLMRLAPGAHLVGDRVGVCGVGCRERQCQCCNDAFHGLALRIPPDSYSL